MLVVRFKIQCQPGRAEHAAALMEQVIAPSRELPGVLHFDIGRCLDDPNSLIAMEVFDDRDALDRQEGQVEVKNCLTAFPQLVAAAPEATIFHVSEAVPHE